MTTTPKTLKALEVREDSWKSPRRTQVGTANRSQGQAHDGPGQDQGRPLGDQGLPIRLGQAQARGGLGQARGGQVTRSARQAPGLLDIML